jgi:hypothetical protein
MSVGFLGFVSVVVVPEDCLNGFAVMALDIVKAPS